jgi:hypothetical protein
MSLRSSSATESTYRTRSKLWRWNGGKGSWYFLTLAAGLSEEIRAVDAGPRRTGFGALRVTATVGRTSWQTSLFPSARHRSFLLPVKASVRDAEGLVEGRAVRLQIVVRRA